MSAVSPDLPFAAVALGAPEPARRRARVPVPGWEAADTTPAACADAARRAMLVRFEIGAHSQQVQAYAARLARGMRLSPARVEVIRGGALLHDIGKFLLPAALLGKPGRLTAVEWEAIRRHPTVGYQLLQARPDLAAASEIVYAHHERFDGTGYPRGLAGEAIPLGARIVAVADVLSAVTSLRPYHAPEPIGSAREQIAGDAGAHFDPSVVRAFLAVTEAEWEMILPSPPGGPWDWPFSALADGGIRGGRA